MRKRKIKGPAKKFSAAIMLADQKKPVRVNKQENGTGSRVGASKRMREEN